MWWWTANEFENEKQNSNALTMIDDFSLGLNLFEFCIANAFLKIILLFDINHLPN